jgi:predicted alpha-1,6-mannanase (GH76 family)
MKNLIITIILASFLKTALVFGQRPVATFDWTDNGGTISAQHAGTTPQSVGYLFDNNAETSYVVSGTTTGWFAYESPVPLIITSYTIVSSNDGTSADNPKNWEFQVSPDGLVWTTTKSESNQTFDDSQLRDPKMKQNKYQSYSVFTSVSSGYRYFRLLVTANNGGTDLRMAEWQIFGFPVTIDTQKDITNNGGVLTGVTGFTNEGIDKAIDDIIRPPSGSSKYTVTNKKSTWLQYQSTTPAVIESYSIATPCCNPDRAPRSWRLLGSNNGADWNVIDERINENFIGLGTNFNMQIFKVPQDVKPMLDWGVLADTAHHSLMTEYWNGSYIKQHNRTNPPSSNSNNINYWWNAHALDVLIDGYSRAKANNNVTRAQVFQNRMDALIAGVIANNPFGGGSLRANYFDDMEWMGLACLRAYHATNDVKWKNYAIQLWDWIELGWDPSPKGGFHWTTDVGSTRTDTVRNAISNSPASILAARLYKLTNDTEYLDWAKKAYNFVKDNLVDNTRGLVWDGFGHINNDGWIFTYNQGVYLGAGLELYLITQDPAYLEEAKRTASYVVDDVIRFNARGALYNGENTADGGLFKGIFMRYLSQLMIHGNLDANLKRSYSNFFRRNGENLWSAATLKPKIMFGKDWLNLPDTTYITSSNHIQGTMLFELLDELKRSNLLPDRDQKMLTDAQKSYTYFKLDVIGNTSARTNLYSFNEGDNDIHMGEFQLFGVDPPISNVAITSPVNNSNFPFNPDITINAEVSALPGVERVEFYNGTDLIGTDTDAPYSITWTSAPSGTHNITAKAIDDDGKTVVSSIVVLIVAPDPTSQIAKITSPGNNQVFTPGSSITIDAEVANFANVTKMEFFSGATLLGEDTSSPYSFTWTPSSVGAYGLSVKATDAANATLTSSVVIVIVSSETNPTVPSVKITSPTTGSSFEASASITFEAEALQVGVIKVEFFNGGTLIGTDTEAPYSITWNNPKSGINYITAKATNDKDETTTSTVVQVIVNGGPVTDVEELLGQKNASYPNPFLDHVYIPLELKSRGSASIQIYNSAGQLIHTSTYDKLNAGQHYMELKNISNNGSQSGYYTYKVITNGETKSGTIIRMK